MIKDQEFELISPCGVYCGECACHKVKDNPALLPVLKAHGIDEEQLPCPGCRAVDGHCKHLGSRCENYACAQEHGVTMCYECEDFPCVRLMPAADRANSLPHNMKMYSQCYINRYGVQAWLENYAEIRLRYFTGKISYGKGPQIEEK
ncbi:MAG TPA: DUF3795 domain-containing protein [Candidatus Cloacimonadota bacterium]|nr:DUF3795 domain-containing protein [Candidatus Cloacimonadota bacterium]HOH79618.1 DUF3795 domain-containing protein [Candidatus Cloacimonadota bacterium]